ncbi:nitroreductase family protein [Mycolicibacterium sp. CBMA 226]|uniref:nitroreductase family protein n=1 Tax=Mycolicibacterium sp. CBMA 226 TaxID=2606611 RepID=UPI001AA1D28C|nr:nitroreductase family protein [Mycolicibacterium sp. CBMA 226]
MTNGIAMTNAIIENLVNRSTTSHYDPNFVFNDDQISELVRIATTAPTSFHMQNWRFIAVRTPAAKASLRPIAWDQPKITESAVTFIIVGQLAHHTLVSERLAAVVEAGIMPADAVPEWVGAARGLYEDSPQRQRDEAVRTASIGATAMVYAANALGLGATPIIGFDDEAVTREYGLADDEVPVMLLSIGAKLPNNWPQKPRREVSDLLTLV